MNKFLPSLLLIFLSQTGFSFINPPQLSSPNNNAVIQAFHTSLLANASNGATNYEFQYDTAYAFNSPHLRWDTSATRSVPTRDLLKGKTYYWRARAFKTGDTSAWSSVWTFRVFTKLTLTSPANATTGPIVTLLCGFAGNNVNYIFEADTVSGLNSIGKVVKTQTSRLFEDSTLFKFGRKIYWRATAYNNLGDTLDWADLRSYTFYTQPTINNTGTTADPLKGITWPSHGLSKILFLVDTTAAFNSPSLVQRLIPAGLNTDTLRDLLFGKKYYCKIRVIYNGDSSLWSAVSSFTVLATGNPLSPANGGTVQNLLVQLSWSTLRGTLVQLQVARDTFFTQMMFDSVFSTSNYNLKDTLTLNTRYYWRIRYFHQLDSSVWSNRYFKTYTGQVNLSSPANGANNQNVWIQFLFSPVVWANSYVIEIDTGKVFGTPSSFRITESKLKTISIYRALDTLVPYGSSIVWRVYAIRGDDTAEVSASRTFSTLSKPVPNFPGNNSIGTGTQTNALVTGITGSDSIEWQLDTSASFNSLEYSTGRDKHVPDGFSPPYILLNLPGDRLFHATYYWRSRCISAIDTSDWSAVWKFQTTQDVWHNYPLNKAVGVELNPKLQWSIQGSVSDYSYQYQFGTDSTFISIPIKSIAKGVTPEAIVSCNYSTTYYWRAKVIHSRDTSKWSVFTSFTTRGVPVVGKVALMAPGNTTIEVPLPSVLLFWYEVLDATSYDIQAAFDPDFNDIVTGANVTGTGVRFSGLQANKRYYWRVKAKVGVFEGPWSNAWWFETVKDVGVSDLHGNNEIIIFPNPVADFLHIKTIRPFQLKIFNGNGRLVLSDSRELTEQIQDVSELPAGVYFLRLIGENESLNHKLIITR